MTDKNQGKTMKRYKFEKKSLHVSRELINKMTDACLTVPKITRAAISEKAGVSLVTAGKFLAAMDECKFTYKKRHFPEDSRPSYCHTLNEALSVLVIDTSSPSFSMSIIRGRSECRFYEQYDYVRSGKRSSASPWCKLLTNQTSLCRAGPWSRRLRMVSANGGSKPPPYENVKNFGFI